MKLQVRFVILLIALLSFLFVIAAQDPPDFSNLEEVLVWILEGGGAMVLTGYVLAYGLENIEGWHKLSIKAKKFWPWVIAAVIAVVAKALLLYGILDYIPLWLQGMILTLLQWIFGQKAYKGIKEGGYAESTRINAGVG
jgi:drug/metabolite transporter (DMT)-like permease